MSGRARPVASSRGRMTTAEAPVHTSPDVAAELFERNPVPMWIVATGDGRVRDVNEAARDLCEVRFPPHSIFDVIAPDERDAFADWLVDPAAVARGGEWHPETPTGVLVPV